MNAPAHDLLDPPQKPGEIGRLGPYRVTGVLGKGGMGEVFKANDSRLKRTIALKVMRAKFAETANSRKRFVEEARSMAAVHHDNVATIFEVGVHQGMPFLAMELLRGETLEAKILNKQTFSTAQILTFAKQASSGLAAAHNVGIIHRDIKPGNLWIESNGEQESDELGRAKILDFGLAFAGEDRLTPRNSVIGSPGYLSPEQARNEALDDRTDLYALGVVLYQMASGKLPLSHDNMASQLIAIICHPIPKLNDRIALINKRNAAKGFATDRPQRTAVPAPLEDLIHGLLSKEPRHRPRSAVELTQMLSRVAQQCDSESQAALQIVTEPARQRNLAGKQVNEDPNDGESSSTGTTPLYQRLSWLQWSAVSAAILLLIAAITYTLVPKRVASEPVKKQRVQSTPAKQVKVSAKGIQPIVMLPIRSATTDVSAGEAARFKIELQNQASSAGENPQQVYAKQRTIAKLVTKLTPKTGGPSSSPAFPMKMGPRQLPGIGETKPVEVFFRTDTLSPQAYDVTFQWRTPSNELVQEIQSELVISENLDDSELLGFQIARTHFGSGGDTFVNSKQPGKPVDQAATRPFLNVQKKGGDDGPLHQHAYLRFDLGGTKSQGKEIDRAVLLLTLAKDSYPHQATIQAYGVSDPNFAWPDSSDAIQWNQTPSKPSITSQRLLGKVNLPPSNQALQGKADAIRIHGPSLDNFLRSVQGQQVTIVLTSDSWSERPIKFSSKDGKSDHAPGLALRSKAGSITGSKAGSITGSKAGSETR